MRNLTIRTKKNSYVIFYTYWIIGQLQAKANDLDLIMDLALIIMTFFEVGFIPYILNESLLDDDIGLNLSDNSRKLRNSIVPKIDKLLKSNNLNSNFQNFEKKKTFKDNINLPENLFETREMIKKENLLRINRLVHYWDIISIVFGELNTCRFASFKYQDAEWCNEKAIGWILLILRQSWQQSSTSTFTLSYIFEIICRIDFITDTLYDQTESYISSSPDTLIQIASMIDSLSLDFEMKIHRDFEKYKLEVESNSTNLNNKMQKHVKFEIDKWNITKGGVYDLEIEETRRDESTIKSIAEESKSEIRSQEYNREELDEIESVEEHRLESISEIHSEPDIETKSLLRTLSSIEKISK